MPLLFLSAFVLHSLFQIFVLGKKKKNSSFVLRFSSLYLIEYAFHFISSMAACSFIDYFLFKGLWLWISWVHTKTLSI